MDNRRMKNYFKKKWRSMHISKEYLRLSRATRFSKRTFKFINISKRRPNLIILGSQKCGTTSLFHYLNDHSDIALSSPFKEPGYFLFEGWAQNYWKRKNVIINSKAQMMLDYMSDNLTDQKYFCDASTYYTQDTNETKYDIPEIIFNESPDAKLIYLFRNPFERLTSAYYHLKRKNPSITLDGMINDWIINTTLYYDRIAPFVKKFGRENIYIIQMDELVQSPQETLNNIFSFLDLEPILLPDFKIHNKTSPDIKEKFSPKTFHKLKPLFDEQKQLLEENLGLQTDWDLDYSSWVQ